jgi:pimeloyl-ACP methyl ester carboxylesterase
MTEMPETHYVKSDDVHIAYQVLGKGPFDLLFVPGFVSNVEAAWRSPDQSAFFRRLASFCRLILFDKRGTGMSDRGAQDFTLEQRMHDVQAANKRHCSVFRKVARCPCFMRPLIRNGPLV